MLRPANQLASATLVMFQFCLHEKLVFFLDFLENHRLLGFQIDAIRKPEFGLILPGVIGRPPKSTTVSTRRSHPVK